MATMTIILDFLVLQRRDLKLLIPQVMLDSENIAKALKFYAILNKQHAFR